jgi:hypothetical protein
MDVADSAHAKEGDVTPKAGTRTTWLGEIDKVDSASLA